MRIAVAMASHETSTFNPTLTTMAAFESLGLHRGPEVVASLHGVGTIGGFLSVVEARPDVEVVPLIAAQTVPGGRVDGTVVDTIGIELVDRLRDAGSVDGVALYLHGACAGDSIDDVDGHWLSLVRDTVGPDTPIAVGLDHHANVTSRMVAAADVIVGHRTQPHDVADTGRLTAQHLLGLIDDKPTVATAWRKIPMLTHQEQFLTSAPPMSTWFDRAREIERSDTRVLQISTFPMQPWFDVTEAGWAIVVHTIDDQLLAEAVANELADLVWSLRHDLSVKTSIAIPDAVARAEASNAGIVLLSDTGDSVIGGSGGDSTAIVMEMMVQQINGPALVPLVDPDIAERTAGLSVGDTTSVIVGGAVSKMYQPVAIDGVVTYRGPLAVETPGFWTSTVDFGFACAIRTEWGAVLISERRGVGGMIPAQFSSVGLNVADFKIVVVKTASNFQFYAHRSPEVIRVNTPGPTQSDLEALPWSRITRPMFPFDSLETWNQGSLSPGE